MNKFLPFLILCLTASIVSGQTRAVTSTPSTGVLVWPTAANFKTANNIAGINVSNVWVDDVRQTFNPGANAAGFNVGSIAGDPATPSNGDLWYDSTANELTARINGANVALGAGAGVGDAVLANSNVFTQPNNSFPNLLLGYTTTATAAGTTTLTATSNVQQYFTGATTQTVVLPVTSTLALGWRFHVVNNSTGVVTVQSSGANNVVAMATNTQAIFTCILTSGTTAASWHLRYTPAYTSAGAITLNQITVDADISNNIVLKSGVSSSGIKLLGGKDGRVGGSGSFSGAIVFSRYDGAFGCGWDVAKRAFLPVADLGEDLGTSSFRWSNVYASTITATTLASTGAATAATLDTGQGANELYDMDQNVLTTSAPTFAGMTGTGTWDLSAAAVSLGTLTTGLVFEGATADAFETTFAITDPTTPDKTITFPDATGTVQLAAAVGNDPDITVEGHLGYDANGDVLRGFDGTNQVALGRKIETIHCTVVLPNDLADSERDAFWMWSNESGMSFVVTGWTAKSDTDDTTLNIEEIDSDGANNATVDAVEIATNGTGLFYGSDATITAATIETGHIIVIDFDDTDTPGQVKIAISGYYDANVN